MTGATGRVETALVEFPGWEVNEVVAHRPDSETSSEPAGNGHIEVAVLDRRGVIIAVNGPWTDFCDANDGNPARTGVGVDYLEICRRAGDEPGAREVADAITAALTAGSPSADRVHIACHAPGEERWFDVLVSSRTGEAGEITGATVMITQVPEHRNDPLEVDRIQRCVDGASDAIVVVDENSLRILYANRGAVSMFGHSRSEFVENMTLGDLTPDISDARLADILGALRNDPDEPVRLWTRALTSQEAPVEVEVQLDWPPPSSPDAPRPILAVLRDLGGSPVQGDLGSENGQAA